MMRPGCKTLKFTQTDPHLNNCRYIYNIRGAGKLKIISEVRRECQRNFRWDVECTLSGRGDRPKGRLDPRLLKTPPTFRKIQRGARSVAKLSIILSWLCGGRF